MPELWPLAFGLYTSSYTYDNVTFPKELKELFESLIIASDDKTVELHLHELAELPKWISNPNSRLSGERLPDFLETIRERKPGFKAAANETDWKPLLKSCFVIWNLIPKHCVTLLHSAWLGFGN